CGYDPAPRVPGAAFAVARGRSMNVDDRFLTEARREPSAEFARRLRDDLARQGPPRAFRRPSWLSPSRTSVAWISAALAGLVLMFSIPSVRASAQAFLDLFRVRNFAAVPVDPARLRPFENGTIDLKTLLADDIQTLEEPGAPVPVGDLSAAAAAAG